MLVQAGAAKNGVRPWVCSWPRVVQQQAQTLQLAARRRSCRSVSSSSALYRFKCWGIVRPKLLEGVRSFDDFFLWRSLASTPTGAKKLLVEKNPDGEVEACMPSCCYAKNVMEIVNAKVSFFYSWWSLFSNSMKLWYVEQLVRFEFVAKRYGGACSLPPGGMSQMLIYYGLWNDGKSIELATCGWRSWEYFFHSFVIRRFHMWV